MQCSNPQCRKPAEDAENGTFRFLEMEVPPEERTIRSDYGFPVCSVPGRFFWLCARCAMALKLRRWTHAGLVVEERANGGRTLLWNAGVKFPVRRAESGSQRAKPLAKAAYLRS